MNNPAYEYALALYKLSKEASKEASKETLSKTENNMSNMFKTQEFYDSLLMINQVIKAYPKYLLLLSDYNIYTNKRISMAEEAFESNVPSEVMSIIKLLIKNRSINILPDCIKEYEKLYEDAMSLSKVWVFSAVGLTEDEKIKLEDRLKKITGNKVEILYKIKPEIIGGLIINIDDKVYDGSVRYRLAKLKEVTKE